MEANAFRLIVTLLAFSHLLFMVDCISASGKIHRHLLHERVDVLTSGNTKNQMMNMEENVFLEEEFMSERMDLEKTDYPGRGANRNHDYPGPGANRNHTPKPPQRD